MLATLFGRLTRNAAVKRQAEVFYGKLVAAARQPGFYGPGRAPDTPEGRFGLVALHLFLVAERVKTLSPDGQDIARALIEAFVTDMDDCMREMGVGDLTVPKRVKRAAAVFYEQSGAYRSALAVGISEPQDSDPLASTVTQTILQAPVETGFEAVVAGYVRTSQVGLARLTDADIAAGGLTFAQPPQPIKT